MSRRFVKKGGVALVSLSRYLLGEPIGIRLATIDELAERFTLSVGVIQNALKALEQSNSIVLDRRGRNGTWLIHRDMNNLLQHADMGNVVCAMPLPYTKLYEGLASGLKAQFTALPLFFAHMRGAEVRLECLCDGIYDMAVVSRLAAQHYLQHHKLVMALSLGAGSYVAGHQLIYRQGERDTIVRVGVDPRSPDQRLLSSRLFADHPVIYVETPYHDCLARLEKGEIDAVVWNIAGNLANDKLALEALPEDIFYQQASEAVVLTRPDQQHLTILLNSVIDKKTLLEHQHQVLTGKIEPSY